MNMTRRQKRELQQHRTTLEGVLADPNGRRFLVWLLTITGVNALNPQLDGRIEGARSIGLRIIEELSQVSPTAYPDLLREAIAREMRTATASDNEIIEGDEDV